MNEYANTTNSISHLGSELNRAVERDSQLVPNLGDPPARPVKIQPLDSGYLVNIGCQSFAATDLTDMMTKIEVYLKNPWETEKLWFDKHDLTLIK